MNMIDRVNAISLQMAQAIVGVREACPKCGALFSAQVLETFLAGGRAKCRECDFYGTWRYGTRLEGARITPVQFVALFFKYWTGDDAPAIGQVLDLDPGTVRHYREMIKTWAAEERAADLLEKGADNGTV